MTKFRTAVCGSIVVVTAVFAVLAGRAWLEGGIGGESPEIDNGVLKILEKPAGSANELKGAEVESDVIFDGATVEDGRVLTYAYTVEGLRNRPFGERIVRMATDQLNQESCADRIVRNAIDGGGAVRYVYRSSGGTRFFVIDVDRQSGLASE